MIRGFLLAIGVLRAVFLSRADLLLENLALRQQLAVFARNGRRPRIVAADRLFWLALRRVWLRWSDVLVFVKPETVVRWHQASFRRYWTWLSQRRRRGRPPIDARLRALIHRLALENPTWGAPRMHGELRMLGFEVSERSVSRCLPRRRPPPGALERWLTFLRNHRGSIAAMDFFTVPTATFRVLYVWFAIEHARRRILYFDVTEHPLAFWVVQQLGEAFPYDTAPHHLVFDRDAIFSARVVSIVESLGIRPARTAYRSPWQNGVAERWIGSVRRELLDHVVVFNERHLRQLLRQYVAYYHHDRTHLALAKATPAGRRAKPTLPSWHYLDLADCIIATTLRRESPHRLATEL
jgi:transposase InsO family protein